MQVSAARASHQVKIESYSPKKYQSLPLFSEIFTHLSKSPVPKSANEEIRDTFHSHDVQSQFSLTVLHRHFPLDEGEVLVEYNSVTTPWRISLPDTCTTIQSELEVEQEPELVSDNGEECISDDEQKDCSLPSLSQPPSPKADIPTRLLNGRVFPKVWCFDESSDAPSLYPIQYSYSPFPSLSSLSTRAPPQAFLRDLHTMLKKHSLLSTYGIGLIDNIADYTSASSLVQGVDDKKVAMKGKRRREMEFTTGRTSVVIPMPDDDKLYQVEKERLVKATWVFPCVTEMAEEGVDADRVMLCAMECYGHKC